MQTTARPLIFFRAHAAQAKAASSFQFGAGVCAMLLAPSELRGDRGFGGGVKKTGGRKAVIWETHREKGKGQFDRERRYCVCKQCLAAA